MRRAGRKSKPAAEVAAASVRVERSGAQGAMLRADLGIEERSLLLINYTLAGLIWQTKKWQ